MNRLKYLIGALILFSGCWTGETIYREREVAYTPDAVKDSITQAVKIQSSQECDSLVQSAVDQVGNFLIDQKNSEGDQWQATVQTVRDSARQKADSLDKLLHYKRTVRLDVQPHEDSVAVLFPVKELRPWRFWEQVRLAIAWPAFGLFLLSALLNFILIRKDIIKATLNRVL